MKCKEGINPRICIYSSNTVSHISTEADNHKPALCQYVSCILDSVFIQVQKAQALQPTQQASSAQAATRGTTHFPIDGCSRPCKHHMQVTISSANIYVERDSYFTCNYIINHCLFLLPKLSLASLFCSNANFITERSNKIFTCFC